MISVFLLGTGYFFLYNIFMTGIGTMNETFQNMGILLLTLIPVMTMRLFSGEYSGRTMELLMTLPLKPWQIVLGKYLGAVTILVLMTAATAINLVPLYLYGNRRPRRSCRATSASCCSAWPASRSASFFLR